MSASPRMNSGVSILIISQIACMYSTSLCMSCTSSTDPHSSAGFAHPSSPHFVYTLSCQSMQANGTPFVGMTTSFTVQLWHIYAYKCTPARHSASGNGKAAPAYVILTAMTLLQCEAPLGSYCACMPELTCTSAAQPVSCDHIVAMHLLSTLSTHTPMLQLQSWLRTRPQLGIRLPKTRHHSIRQA